MTDTSHSLLARVCRSADTVAWNRLVEVYAPLMRRWLKNYEVQDADADDLIQEVLSVLSRELPAFDHNGGTGAFRSWLRQILVNRLRHFWRSRDYRPAVTGGSSLQERLNQLEDESSQLSRIWDEDHDRHVISRLLDLIRPNFQAKTWEAFQRQMFGNQPPEQVAADLGMSIGSVYVARSRVLSALRREANGMVDSL